MKMMLDCSSSSCPGRICFAGEYLDWLVGPSFLAAVDLRLNVKARLLPSKLDYIVINSGEPFNRPYFLPLSKIGVYSNGFFDLINAAIKIFFEKGAKLRPFSLDITSEVPIAAGLSSSAAITIATIAALSKLFETYYPVLEICSLAHLAETNEIGTGAGQMDFYVCGLGGAIYLDSSSTPPNPICKYYFPEEYKIVIVDTQTPRKTTDASQIIREKLQNNDPNIVKYIENTLVAVNLLRNVMSNEFVDVEQIGSTISNCHGYLRDYLQVSTDLLNLCVRRSLEQGALGAKLTGSGFGGAMFAFLHQERLPFVIKALSELPVKIQITNLDYQGLLVK